MKKYFIVAFLFLVTFPSFAQVEEDTNLFIFPRFHFLETPLFDVLHGLLGPNASLVFLPEDTMKTAFKEKVRDAKYKCYIYYNRATQISGPTGGGFRGDFIEQAAENLKGQIAGIIVPVITENNTRSLMATNNIVKAYQDSIQEDANLDVVFMIDFNLMSTARLLDGYKNKEFRIACLDRLDRGKFISVQKKAYKRNREKIPVDFIWGCDLRIPNTSDPEEFFEFFEIFRGKDKLIVFENTEDSINAFAIFIDYLGK